MRVLAYDPVARDTGGLASVTIARWPDHLQEADFIVVTCALTESSRHMVNADTLARARKGVRIVNVARGPVIDEPALVAALRSGHVYSAALDVFEQEPLPMNSPLREHPRCIFGSHNSSNTSDAVDRTSRIAIGKLFEFLGVG
jgi:D-3-phosphoglycerate dehydrogenase